jgi:methylglyoxal synthase
MDKVSAMRNKLNTKLVRDENSWYLFHMAKNVVLIAHDHLKPAMVEWTAAHIDKLKQFNLFATGTTGTVIEKALGLNITKFKSGPLGGDQQIGAKICEGDMQMAIFFWDPLEPQPHDVDVKALLRIAAVYNIPMACNRATADLLIQAFEP